MNDVSNANQYNVYFIFLLQIRKTSTTGELCPVRHKLTCVCTSDDLLSSLHYFQSVMHHISDYRYYLSLSDYALSSNAFDHETSEY